MVLEGDFYFLTFVENQKDMSAEELRRKSELAINECKDGGVFGIDVSEMSNKDLQLLIDILENDRLEPVEQDRNFLIVQLK